MIDLETTGFEPPAAAVCEIGWCDLTAVAHNVDGVPTSWDVGQPYASYVWPGHSVPPETSAIHHIVDEDLHGAPLWSKAAEMVVNPKAMPGNPPVALVAHNAKFEKQFCTDDLTGGLPWICTYKCALRIFPHAPGHSNGTLRYWLKPLGLDRATAAASHRAGPDAYVTAFLLRALLAEASIEKLIAWSAEPALQIKCWIGKNRGQLWTEVDESFLWWVSARDFDEDVLFTVRHEIARREAVRKAGESAFGLSSSAAALNQSALALEAAAERQTAAPRAAAGAQDGIPF
ncbi:3'-5' exonuclease [Methylobacterium fujisawaense]|uniref:3'-5' exonuclease n=1 Tax=Methylobacterium fujisawaense TaxID=107400 RepID=UPI002F35032F